MEQPKKIDLHAHSSASDGTLSPSELIKEAERANLAAIALTDHDTVDGIAEAKTAAESSKTELISGVELSTDHEGTEVHMVGLFLDETNPKLLEHLARFRDNRDNRNLKMYAKLREEGFDITEEALREMFPDAVLTRAHVARYLLDKGYIQTIAEAFDTYIGDGCRCHIPREKISPKEAIALIHEANGKAVLAHPILYHLTDAKLNELVSLCALSGLDGIEAYYSTYQPADERYIKQLAAKYHLCLSGGSDFHGSNKPHIRLGSGMGNLYVPSDLLEPLRNA